jgi:hypothetical protein
MVDKQISGDSCNIAFIITAAFICNGDFPQNNKPVVFTDMLLVFQNLSLSS